MTPTATVATVHRGARGGVEYRLWNADRTIYRVVSRFMAERYCAPDELERAAAMRAHNAEAKRSANAGAQAWRALMRGG